MPSLDALKDAQLLAAGSPYAPLNVSPTKVNTSSNYDPLKDPSIVPTARDGYKWTWTGAEWIEEKVIANSIDAMKDPSKKPDPRTGFDYVWDAASGSWVEQAVVSPITDIKPTTNIAVLKAALGGLGFSAAILDQSTSFLNGLLKDGIDADNALEIFLNNKDYTLKDGTTITSPFYTAYGYLNEGLTVPKTASELFNTVEGYKGVVSKYNLSQQYLTPDALKKYLKNDVTVTDLAQRAATAQLRAVESDPFQVDALIKQGYISSAAGLTDFYMDPNIGQQQLELNKQTGVFTAEALRRAQTGVLSDAEQLASFKKLTAGLAAKGYTEAQISQFASTGFENIAQTLAPEQRLSGIYEKGNAASTSTIQSELTQEQFNGLESQRRKKLAQLEKNAFAGSSGTYGGRTTSYTQQSTAGQF